MLHFDEENGVLKMKIPKDWQSNRFDEHEAANFIDEMERLFEGKEHRYLLTDVSQIPGKTLSRKFRKWIAEKATRIGLEKVAVVGVSPVKRMASMIVMAALGKSRDTAFFETEKGALEWFSQISISEEIRETPSLV